MAILMLASVLTGCGNSSDKGPSIPVYISDEIINFDPAFAYNDDAAVKILSLLYEGLTKISASGKVENAMMKSYKYSQQEDGTYMMEIQLNESYWNDGISVSADDFSYAFKRIMDPEFSSEAACLLYELQNAREVKAGERSIDDLGVRSADTSVLQFIFDHDIDIDVWLETLASPALVPLRETAVSLFTPQDIVYQETVNNSGETVTSVAEYDISAYAWSTDPQCLLTNGPFSVKKISKASRSDDGQLVLQRNPYYFRDPKGKEAVTKYVSPLELKIVFPSSVSKGNYTLGEGEQEVSLQQLVAYAAVNAEDKTQSIVFDSDISLVSSDKTGKATKTDMLTQHAYYFNTTNKLFENAQVRLALSKALDREEIAKIVQYAVASDGWISDGIYKNTARKKEYRDSYGSLIEKNANVDEARSMLKSAGVTRGSFTITCRDSAVEKAIAEYVKGVWEELGFSVKVSALGTNNTGLASTEQTKYYSLYRDEFTNAFVAGDFDVIAIDYTPTSTYAFASLAPFATGFTGRAISLWEKTLEKDYKPDLSHITGWQNTEFDNLIGQAYEEKDMDAKSDLLFSAEKILMEEMPVMPLIQYQNAYVKTSALSKLDTNYYGAVLFTKAKLRSAGDYVATEAQDEK